MVAPRTMQGAAAKTARQDSTQQPHPANGGMKSQAPEDPLNGPSSPGHRDSDVTASQVQKSIDEYKGSFRLWYEAEEARLEAENHCIKQFVDSTAFMSVCLFLIVVNSLMVGLETDLRVQGSEVPVMLGQVDTFFICFFTAEAILRFAAYKKLYFCDRYNIFDVVLLLGSAVDKLASNGDTSYVMMLRMLRLMRTLKLVRGIRFFRELRLLCFSLMKGMVSLSWSVLLFVLVTYIFAVLITDLLHSAGPISAENGYYMEYFVADPERFREYFFGSVSATFFTLFQVLTLESWTNGIARPANGIMPGILSVFVLYVLIMTFGLLNIVVGSFVEHSMSTASADAEYRLSQKKAAFQRKLEELRELFLASDEDQSGLLSFEEFQAMSGDERMVEVFSEMDVMCTDTEFFQSIDLDNEGSVSVDEFVKGVMRVQAQPTNLDVYVVDGMARRMEKIQREEVAERQQMKKSLESLVQTVAQMQASVNTIVHGTPSPPIASLAYAPPQVDGAAATTAADVAPMTYPPAPAGGERRVAQPQHGARAGFPICPVECIDKQEDGYVPNGMLVSPRVQLEYTNSGLA